MSDAVTDAMNTFVQLSSLLTGFNVDVIAPTIDSVNLKQTLFDYAQGHTGPTFDALLAEYATAADGKTVDQMTPEERQQVGEAVLGSPDPKVSATARAINKVWYLGSWYQPFDYNGNPQDLTGGVVVSDQAYIKGLAWQVMQSHAMGFSTFTYGYSNEGPPALENFTSNPAPQGGQE